MLMTVVFNAELGRSNGCQTLRIYWFVYIPKGHPSGCAIYYVG